MQLTVTVINARGLWFESRVGQIGHSVANGSPPLPCYFGVGLPDAQVLRRGDGPHHSSPLRRNTAKT